MTQASYKGLDLAAIRKPSQGDLSEAESVILNHPNPKVFSTFFSEYPEFLNITLDLLKNVLSSWEIDELNEHVINNLPTDELIGFLMNRKLSGVHNSDRKKLLAALKPPEPEHFTDFFDQLLDLDSAVELLLRKDLKKLSAEDREILLEALKIQDPLEQYYPTMRELRDIATKLGEVSRPKSTEIPLGAQDLRKQTMSSMIHEFLRIFGTTQDLEKATQGAIADSELWVSNWNRKREYQVQIAETSFVSFAEALKRSIETKKVSLPFTYDQN